MWIENIRERAKKLTKKIILPEGNDSRIVEAAKKICEIGIADIEIINTDPIEGLDTIIADPELSSAASKLAAGEVDGMVAGAAHSTAAVIRCALRRIGTEGGASLISSFFLMESEDRYIGENGGLVFADCAVIPDPDSEKLASIALTTAVSVKKILGWEPRVAFLSFSTKGSAKHKEVDKVLEAVELLRQKNPGFDFDGELQLDSAIIPDVASSKDPSGIISGKANILIFPDLNSGNIGYKIAQRLGNMRAVGPVLQGFKKPVNDLSRGCSVEDIIDVVAVTALQA